MEILRRTAVKLALGDQPVEELPMVAAEALARGLDSLALRTLAGQSRHDPSVELFHQAMDELGSSVPAVEEAWLRRMLWAAEAIVKEKQHPHPASDEIYWSACHLERSAFTVRITEQFLGLWSAWEEHPDERRAIEESMRMAAADLLRWYVE